MVAGCSLLVRGRGVDKNGSEAAQWTHIRGHMLFSDGRPLSILRKPLSAISVADLDALIKSAARETGELEFKGALPFVPTKGQSAVSDRWIEKGDCIGDYARDQVLAEIVAFANADGGTLVLGLHETKDEPRRAERLEALPKCEDLASQAIS
jgi:hypothetical protein